MHTLCTCMLMRISYLYASPQVRPLANRWIPRRRAQRPRSVCPAFQVRSGDVRAPQHDAVEQLGWSNSGVGWVYYNPIIQYSNIELKPIMTPTFKDVDHPNYDSHWQYCWLGVLLGCRGENAAGKHMKRRRALDRHMAMQNSLTFQLSFHEESCLCPEINTAVWPLFEPSFRSFVPPKSSYHTPKSSTVCMELPVEDDPVRLTFPAFSASNLGMLNAAKIGWTSQAITRVFDAAGDHAKMMEVGWKLGEWEHFTRWITGIWWFYDSWPTDESGGR